ncbi:unnamed protein product (macronuclear) [Paramecium tetraurelia]|uniref:Kinesin-like protein n=1 Tax=Paramecium tetraurelia TaxID=5888 RepID=A0D1C9_PARTE|nr:uncharacterized protein GSPATT00012370001 [Paramecium tetraurelia]CAK76846.1 unnamed protein product [Paramecium tetraurelia]|eukprot:XP_001444243.1 hypothetical protein (macronuclear) [Paramecium tetraurelia strain d4-2]
MTDIIDRIVVAIRKRPLSQKEILKKEEDIIIVQNDNSVIVKEIKQKVDLTKYIEEHQFNFDLTFNQNHSNEQVYINAVRPIIRAAFQRAKVTCFAYGQTGSGKTYTMIGDIERQVPGMYLLAGQDIFQIIEMEEYTHLQVYVSFFEIYCGKLYDLLSQRNQIQIREDAKGNVNMINLMEKKINSVQQLMHFIQLGQNVRITASNSSNSESSRSHAILQVILKSGKTLHGKMSFIDLAGSERGADVQDQNKQTRIDGAEINKSLLALKECIRALDLNKNHTPFRGSKLTLVLKDSLTGNCKTVMIGNISPSSQSSEHTLNTLRYADRVKELKKPENRFSQGDLMQRELMLARQTKNVTRKQFNEEEDQENVRSFSPISNIKRQSLQPLHQSTQMYNNQNFNQQKEIRKSDISSVIHKFNLSSIPQINVNFNNTQQLNQSNYFPTHQRINSATSYQNDYDHFNNSQSNLFLKTQNPTQQNNQLFQQHSFNQTSTYSDLFSESPYHSQQEQGFRQLNQQAVQQSQELEEEFDYSIPQKSQRQGQSNCSQIVQDHKNLIDKIIEISKLEMKEITMYENQNDMQSYLQTISQQLQQKVDLIQEFQQKVYEVQQQSQHWTFQPNDSQNRDELFLYTNY